MEIEKLYQLYLKSAGICTDTRKLFPNCLFIALKGDNFNGNSYAKEAVKKGAIAAVIDEKAFEIENTILVENGLKTLQDLAHYHRKKLDAHVIAITGSNGKTTTKELLTSILQNQYKLVATPGNFNNHIGLPLTILSAPVGTEMLLLEMGDSKAGDILELCEISIPDLGYVTNIGKDHLAGFENGFEGNVASKKELYDYLHTNKGKLLVQQSDELLMEITAEYERTIIDETSIGIKKAETKAGLYLSYMNPDGNRVQTNLVGAYNYANILAAYAISLQYNVSIATIDQAIRAYKPENNRSQLIQTEKNTLIMDAYNANPSSVALALESLAQMKGKKLALLGDMLELGEGSKEEHQEIMNLAAALSLDCIFVGHEFAACTARSNQLVFRLKTDAENHLKQHTPSNQTILLKGSRGMAMETLKKYL